jgi:hypothetical protein
MQCINMVESEQMGRAVVKVGSELSEECEHLFSYPNSWLY